MLDIPASGFILKERTACYAGGTGFVETWAAMRDARSLHYGTTHGGK